jgi:hypothetical protein
MEALVSLHQLVIVGQNQSGFLSATYDDGHSFLMYSAQGFRGFLTSNSANIGDLTFSSNPVPEHFFPMIRKELADREPPGTEVLRVVINAPNGMRTTSTETAGKVTIISEAWEADEAGLRIGASAINTNTQEFSPIPRQTFSTSVEVVPASLSDPVRKLGILLKVSQLFNGQIFGNNQELVQDAIPVAGSKRLFLTQSSQSGKIGGIDVVEDLLQVVRKTNSGSVRSASDRFNVLAARRLPIFNPGTGLFGAKAATQDFADIFMHHAANVGPIAISNIDFEELYAIQDAINAGDPEDGFFSYTFSNKQAALDSELATICQVARVTLWKEGNRYRFTRDETRAKVGNITSRNMLDAGAKSITLSLPDPFDGVVLEYIDPTTDKMATIEFPESSTTRLKRMRIPGIRNFNQAWRRVRYEYLKMISQRISRGITASREANLWSIGDRLTVFDHTRMEITPLASSGSAFRNDTELQFLDAGDVFVCSEKIEVDGTMAAEFFFDHTGDGSIQNIQINVDPVDTRRFTIDPSTAPATITLLVDNARQVANGLQIGERILIYPAAVSANQLTQDDYLIINKRPDSLGVILELIRYNADLYQFDGVAPP